MKPTKNGEPTVVVTQRKLLIWERNWQRKVEDLEAINAKLKLSTPCERVVEFGTPGLAPSDITEASCLAAGNSQKSVHQGEVRKLDNKKLAQFVGTFVKTKSWKMVKFVPNNQIYTNSPYLLPKLLEHCGFTKKEEQEQVTDQVKKLFKIATNQKRHNVKNRLQDLYKGM